MLRQCKKRFRSYIVKVLNRLPEDVYKRDIVLDCKLKIISFDGTSCYGLFLPFGSPVENMNILNEDKLNEPEFSITHTIAHELAHKISSKVGTALREIDAENLLKEWGFEAESKGESYYRSILETDGYNKGYEWAKSHNLNDFEEYYDEWNEGRLGNGRYKDLLYTANTGSIFSQMSHIDESTTTSRDKEIEIPEDTIIEDGSVH